MFSFVCSITQTSLPYYNNTFLNGRMFLNKIPFRLSQPAMTLQ